jgi:hypothetical protein
MGSHQLVEEAKVNVVPLLIVHVRKEGWRARRKGNDE